MRENPLVEHIGVGDDDLGFFSYCTPHRRGRVAVESVHFQGYFRGVSRLEQRRHLVLTQRFGGEKEEGAAGRRLGDFLKNGQVKAEAFPAGRGCSQHHIIPIGEEVESLRLMAIEVVDVARSQSFLNARIDPFGQGNARFRCRGNAVIQRDGLGVARGLSQVL